MKQFQEIKMKRNESWRVKAPEPMFISFDSVLPNRRANTNKDTEMKEHGTCREEQMVITKGSTTE